MGLKVTLEHGATVEIGDVRIEVIGQKTRLLINAPQEMKIRRWDADGRPATRNLEKANQLTPEQQRNAAQRRGRKL